MGTSFDPQRLDAFFGDANVPDEDKRAVAAQLRAQPPAAPETSTTTTTTSTADEAAHPGVLASIGEAAMDVMRPVAEAASTALAADRTPLQRVSDVATIAAPIAYPPATIGQVGAQSIARATGASHEEAARLGGAVGGMMTGGAMVAGGAEALAGRRATQTALPKAAGADIEARLPSAADAARKRVQSEMYGPVEKYAAEKGLGYTPGSPEAEKLATALDDAHAKWGGPTPAGSKLLDKLRPAGEAGPPAPVTYADLDEAKRLLPGKAKQARGAIDEAIDSLFAAPEHGAAASKLRAAKTAWRTEVRPAQKLAAKVRAAEGHPLKVLNILTDKLAPENAETAARLLGGEPAQWDDALKALNELRSGPKGALAGFGRYLQHKAAYAGALGVATGHFEGGILGALGMLAVGQGLQYVPQAARFLKAGMSGAPAAAALAKTISTWGESQDDEAKKGAARDVASALQGSQSASPSATPQPTASTSSPTTGVSLPYANEISRVASVVGVDPQLLHTVALAESSYNPRAVSDQGAVGLMQLTPPTFETMRPSVEHLLGRPADINNPWDSITASALLWKNYLARTGGNIEAAARYYYGGLDSRQHGARTAAYGRMIAANYASRRGTGG